MTKENRLAAITFVVAFVGSLAATVLILQSVYATAAIAPPETNQTSSSSNQSSAVLPSNQTIANVTASPLNVTILGTNGLLNFDPTGLNSNLQVIGEVFNNGTGPINASDLVIPAAVYDVNGTLVGVSVTFPDQPVIEKNNSSPFKATFFDSDVKFGVLNALFYKVQAANESALGILPPPPPLALGGMVPGGDVGGAVPGGVPFGGIPGGPIMGPILPPPIPPNQTLPNQTGPTTNQTQGAAHPDESCLFDASQPKCAAVNGECPDGFNMNEDENCFPQHSQCPDGYHSQEDDETGQCYPDSQSCDPGYIMDPDFPTCGKIGDICDKHPDLNECEDFTIQQEAITSSDDDNQTNTDNGQEQEEEEQGQEVQAGSASISQPQQQGSTSEQQGNEEVNSEEENSEEDN